MPTALASAARAKGRGVAALALPPPLVPPAGVTRAASRGRPALGISSENYSNILHTTSTMPPTRAITNETRLIDLTVGDLMDVFFERLTQTLAESEKAKAHPEALVDTWEAATLLGIVPKHDPGPEPPSGTPAWRAWREKHQAVRDDVAHRFQQLLIRRPQLAQLARYDGRRRYFVRADLTRYLDSLAPTARRSRR